MLCYKIINNFVTTKPLNIMTKDLSIKKGLDINIIGGIESDNPPCSIPVKTCAVVPDDFTGLTPKAIVTVGDNVKKGTPIIIDKKNADICLVSPISGKIKEIARGERRKILHIEIEYDGKNDAVTFDTSNINTADDARLLLMKSGLWAQMRQRPYDIIPNANSTPRDIFITAFDSAPLAPSFDDILEGAERELEEGVKLLKLLTNGNIYISTRHNSLIKNVNGAIMINVKGPHPAGNVGVQIANIAPINKGETVWTLDAITLRRIGHLVINGTIDTSTIVALTGSEIATPKYITTIQGASIDTLLNNELKNGQNIRIISGNVLTGTAISLDSYLRFPYNHITVIPEGDDVADFLGWASLSTKKMSVSRSFPGHFLFNKKFSPDARILGGRRAMIMSGEYDRVFPFDIYAEYLLKAIISRNIDQMEALGIYEVAPEDFALCEYVDTSKIEIQKIVREGLDFLRKELE